MEAPPNIHVAGVPIHFPHTPYRAQNALMHAVVTSVKKQHHALIESPTGTGKSLALLCSSLGMQRFMEKQRDGGKQEADECEKPGSEVQANDMSERGEDQVSSKEDVPREHVLPSVVTYDNNYDSDDADFAPQKTFRDVSWQKPLSREQKSRQTEEPENTFMFQRLLAQRDNPLDDLDEPDDFDESSAEPTQKPVKRIPRIFYATRTHNQVAQVIGELRKTVYRPRISILASRREYCIRDEVRSLANRDETCKGLVKARDCQLYNNASDLATHGDLRDEAWDIEELNALGKKHGGCPYYASHELYQSAQLILCPYSFLVDPIVRKARGVNLSGDVIILDEAHNIENFARDAASFEASVADMRRATEEVGTMILSENLAGPVGDLIVAYRKVKSFLECFLALSDVAVNSPEFQQQENYENAVYERRELLERLAKVEVTSTSIKTWRGAYEYIVNFGDGKEANRILKMADDHLALKSSQTQAPNVRNSPAVLLEPSQNPAEQNDTDNQRQYGYGGGMKSPPPHGTGASIPEHKHGYDQSGRVAHKRRRKGGRRYPNPREQAPWISKFLVIANALLTTLEYLFDNPEDFIMVVDRRTVDFVTVVKLQIHCLNAAVCFHDISSKARSVIVTSGTLSPLSSFAGELGTKFSIAKTLPHVIDVRRQLFVGIAGQGPGGVVFDATFHGSAKFSFQDSLGDAIIDYCRVVPGGVLIFFPSYRMMEQLRGRWKASGVLDELERIKGTVLAEPNKRGEEFDSVVKEYHEAALVEGGGAVLMGVCRGKLSEGVDFRDSTSRGVIVIGIPFPHKGDIVVNRKKCWNDRVRSERKQRKEDELQSGMEWYEMQAFRALNQALGRTVRHRYDYGAILLIDCRFRLKRMMSLLPEWTKRAVQSANWSHRSLVGNLQQFYNNIQARIAEIAEEDRGCVQPSTGTGC